MLPARRGDPHWKALVSSEHMGCVNISGNPTGHGSYKTVLAITGNDILTIRSPMCILSIVPPLSQVLAVAHMAILLWQAGPHRFIA